MAFVVEVDGAAAAEAASTGAASAMLAAASGKTGLEDLEGLGEGGCDSAKGLIGRDFEEYLTKKTGGSGSFSVSGREFDGKLGNRWWEAKSGQYWDMLMSDSKHMAKFQSDMCDRLKIATETGATYELFSNTPIPQSVKQWLINKGIKFTELLT